MCSLEPSLTDEATKWEVEDSDSARAGSDHEVIRFELVSPQVVMDTSRLKSSREVGSSSLGSSGGRLVKPSRACKAPASARASRRSFTLGSRPLREDDSSLILRKASKVEFFRPLRARVSAAF
jgi:hypothetical protein